MPNTALNRTTVALLTNKSGGNLNYGDVVIGDTANAQGFTTTTTSGLSTREIGVILEPNGIANNATGLVATCGWVPRINLNTAATAWQFIKTHTVAGQGTPHSSPQVEGDFAVALDASATPTAILFGSPNGPTSGGGSGTVTHTAGALTASAVVVGNGTDDIKVLASLGTTTTVLHGNAAGLPTFGAVNLAAGGDVTGALPTTNLGPGAVVQMVNTSYTTTATGATTIPADNTIPQITEGTEFFTKAITPTSGTNKLRIDVIVHAANASASQWITAALFQDSTANALASSNWFCAGIGFGGVLTLTFWMTAGTTSSTTFRVRVGANSGTVTVNGSGGTGLSGGVTVSGITITEIAV